MNWKEIPIPLKMRELVIDSRGFPVPYIIYLDAAGTYQFKINDTDKREKCLAYRLCAICGLFMENNDMWLVGGPLSAFHPQGCYNDSALHHECAEYALRVCPYLAIRSYSKLSPVQWIEKVQTDTCLILMDPTVLVDRPEIFVVPRISGYSLNVVDEFITYVIPHKPYLEIEYWDAGEKLDPADIEIIGGIK